MPFFCSSANHFSASFEVDEQKTASATFHFSRFPFSDLFLHFALPSILSFICMLFFCSSADHSSAWFEVDEQKIASATFHFSLFLVCFYILACLIFYLSFACHSFGHQQIIPMHHPE
jgi:hypothetical protein